jgi:hypothetical protein
MDANMKRPPLITIVMVLQWLLGLLLAGLTIYLLALTRSAEALGEPDAADTIQGLKIGAAVLGVPALITLLGAWGLWKQRSWGWVLSLATDVGALAVLVYNNVGESKWDADEIALAAGFVVPVILLLLPVVRKYYWNSATGSSTVSAAAPK